MGGQTNSNEFVEDWENSENADQDYNSDGEEDENDYSDDEEEDENEYSDDEEEDESGEFDESSEEESGEEESGEEESGEEESGGEESSEEEDDESGVDSHLQPSSGDVHEDFFADEEDPKSMIPPSENIYSPDDDEHDDDDIEAAFDDEDEPKEEDNSRERRIAAILLIICCILVIVAIVLGVTLGRKDKNEKGTSPPTLAPVTLPPTPRPTTSPTVTPSPTEQIVPTLTPTEKPTSSPTVTEMPTKSIPPTLLIPPDADTYVSDGPDSFTSFGSQSTMLIQNGPDDIFEQASTYALISFPLTEMPAPERLVDYETRATLRLTHIPSETIRDPAIIQVARLPSTPLNIEDLHSGIFVPTDVVDGKTFQVSPSDSTIEVDVTDLLFDQSPFLRDTQATQIFFMLENRGVDQEEGDQFYTREATDPATFPELFLEFVDLVVSPTSTPDGNAPTPAPTVTSQPTSTEKPTAVTVPETDAPTPSSSSDSSPPTVASVSDTVAPTTATVPI